MKPKICSELAVAPGLILYHTGPSLDHGPLPSLFYFALSGSDSLCLDPFNQIVQFLHGKMIRIFSLTLPGHENNLPPTQAIALWAEEMAKGIDPLNQFFDEAKKAIDFAIANHFVDPKRMGVAGLSRGGFVAAHIAALEERIRFILGFAPLTRLDKTKEFQGMNDHPMLRSFALSNIVEKISDRHIRLYIGNEDTRVGTRDCFDFAMDLVKHKKSRISQVELLIYPSIGQMGHGTPPEIFQAGAHWITECLK